MGRLERIMDMINVLCLDEGRLNYAYIRSKYGMSNREFRRDIDFIRERLVDIGYMDKKATVEYVRTARGNYYVYNGDKPALNKAFVNSTIAEALAEAADNPLREQFEGGWNPEKPLPEGYKKPVKYMYSAIEKVNYNLFTTLVAAIKETRSVALDYINSKGKETNIIVHPMELINYSQIWYLKVETEYKSIRTYSLSRIQSAKLLDETFVRDEEKLKKSEGSYGIFSSIKDEPIWYTMSFKGVAANIVSNQIWHKDQKGKWKRDGSYELSVPAVSDVEVMGKLLSFSPDSRPISPDSFVERYNSIIKECLLNTKEDK